MKINPQLLQRLSSNNINTDNFLKRIEEQKTKKLEPEQFANSQTNFRVRTINDQREKEENNQSQKEENNKSQLQKSFYKDDNNQLQLSQLTRSTNIQNSQVTLASPVTKISTHRQVIIKTDKTDNQKPIISVRAQQSLYMVSKRSSLMDTELSQSQVENQNIPKAGILKRDTNQSFTKNTYSNTKQMQESMLNDQLSPSQLMKTSQIPNLVPLPQKKILIGKMRGSSQIMVNDVQSKAPLQVSQHKVTMSKDLDVSQTQSSSSFTMKRRIIRGSSLSEKAPEKLMIFETINLDIVEKITSKKSNQLTDITKVSLRYNSQQDSLQLLGEFLPSLLELRLDTSIIFSLRDLGTRMQNLRILWISRSQVKDISGVNGLFNLKELYCCFNNISDLSPLAYHDNLEVLDAEANNISDESQIEFIESLYRLEFLNLAQNPILKKFPDQVSQRLFSVLQEKDDSDVMSEELFDDQEFTNNVDKLYELAQQIFDVDELTQINSKLKEELKVDWMEEPDELNLIAEQIKAIKPINYDIKPQRPSTAMNRTKESFSLFECENDMNPDPTSTLTLLQDEVLCGNPLKAARYNKNNKQISGGFDPTDRKSMDIRNIMKQFQK